jgi:hydrophobic/amphiphilic exporter-1 (mainly G- bacteria), HAE1 family
MNLIRLSIERPIAVLAAVVMVVLFGIVALQNIPIQLAPDVNRPVISINTSWPGAAPAEVEREIINRQEEALRGLEGLAEMSSASSTGSGRITLEFNVGQDMDRALLLVANRLNRVSGYPDEADEPLLDTAGSDDQPIAWFTFRRAPGNERDINTYREFLDDVIRERIERVPGVSRVNVFGGADRELKITVDPLLMAEYGLTVPDIVLALRAANVSVSAGDVDEGKRRYVVRSEGEFKTPDDVRAVLLRSITDPATGRVARVTVGDVAEVAFGIKEATAAIRYLGEPALAMNAQRETGANVIETMAGIREAVEQLNAGLIPDAGLTLVQVYDETTYIRSSIDLVKQNIWVGGTLAAIILFLFLRSGSATLIVTLAIPVSIIGSFVAMAALGRSINVISLAGLAFAVGMVVDAAIVVLENIFRLRQRGMPAARAAYEGARQVWGAVLVSALTTVMVFIPILTMDLEVGQLFRDIAVAISVAVILSLIVAITVIPALANRLLGRPIGDVTKNRRLPVIDRLASGFVEGTTGFVRRIVGHRIAAIALVLAVCGAAGMATWLFLPKLEYLPEGNRNLVFAVMLPPPGYNLETMRLIAESMEAEVRPMWASETGPEAAPGQPPKFDNFFFVARPTTTFIGGTAAEPRRVSELIPVLQPLIFREPGTFGVISQPSLFGRAVGGGRSIDLNVSGPDLENVLEVAQDAASKIEALLPRSQGHQMRPRPGLELGAPEVRITPNPLRLTDAGVTARDFASTVDAFNDGLRVAEITVGGKRIDLTLAGPVSQITETQGIDQLPVVTRSGEILPVASLANVEVTSGPIEIRHLERERTVTLDVRPAAELPLEAAMEILQAQVIDELRAEGLPPGVTLRLAGVADKLTETWLAMEWQFLLAIAIVYLVMAVLFESFVYPLVICLAVPLATAGGVGGLAILNLFTYQPLDMLTLLGFVILVGIVVNNAILLVHQTLHHARVDDMTAADAIVSATRDRIRPIFMSTLTSIFGMLPLVTFPGAGSELYRGLGSVVLGGLALSAVLTLAIIPPLLTLIGPLIERQRPSERRVVDLEPRQAAE